MRPASLSRPALCAAALLLAGAAAAKLPALSDEAKAKAAEAAAKAAWSDKVAAFQTCKAMDKAVSHYEADAKKAGKEAKPGATPACTDPGPFAYTPPAAASAPAASAPAAAPAAAAAPASVASGSKS